MKKIICFILLFVLFLTPALAYADDPSEVTSIGSSAVPEELEDDFRRTAENLYLVLSDNGTRATPHDVNDVYNLLVQIFYNQSNGSNEIVIIRQKLASIDTYCYTIMNNVTSINTTLSNFYNSINPDFDQTGISIYDLIHTFYDTIFDIDGTDGDISLMELLLVIEDEIENVELQLSTIISSASSIDSKCSTIASTLNTLNTNLINVYSAIQNQSSLLDGDLDSINANLALMISNLNNLKASLVDITWDLLVTYTTSQIDFKYCIGDYSSINDFVAPTLGQNISINPHTKVSIIFKIPNALSNSTIYKFVLPVGGASMQANNINLSLLELSTLHKTLLPNQYIIDSNGNTKKTTIYLFYPNIFSTLGANNDSRYIMEFTTGNTSQSLTFLNDSAPISRINKSALDTYQGWSLLAHLNQIKINQTLNTFKDIYASEDLIKAKEAQQATEDQIIEDFTGSGAGSISLSDAIVAKNTSSAIKNGFNTGASAVKALNALDYNNPAGLYIWFTQDVANYFTLYTPNRGTSNQTFDSIIWTDSTTNVIDDIDYDYYSQLTQ